MVSGWQIDWIPGMLSIKMGISAFLTDSQIRPPPAQIRGGRDESELEPNTADFNVDHHLWGHWAFIRTSRPITSAYTALALLWHWTNASQLARERSRVHRRWAQCLMSNASLQSSLNQGLSLLLTQITLVGTKRSTS